MTTTTTKPTAPHSLLTEDECDAIGATLYEVSRDVPERVAPIILAAAIVAQAIDRLTAAVREAAR